MSRFRSHSRASSRGSDFYDGAVSFNQDDGSFADQSEDDEVMKVPQRLRCHSLSRLDTLQNKCRLQFEEPFVESKQVADFNVEQLLMQLQDHRATLDAVNPELFKKVHSTGVYFISVDVQVRASPPVRAPRLSQPAQDSRSPLACMLKISAVAESISAFSSRWPAERLPGMRPPLALPIYSTPDPSPSGTIPDYYRSLSFVISECTRRANISSYDLSMMIAVEGMKPRTMLPVAPRMTRHSSLLQFATANAAYTSAFAGVPSQASQQDVLLLLRNRFCFLPASCPIPLLSCNIFFQMLSARAG
jgi:hypothetical protein